MNYEYLVENKPADLDNDDLESWLNAHSHEGWRFCQQITGNKVIFERHNEDLPKPQENGELD